MKTSTLCIQSGPLSGLVGNCYWELLLNQDHSISESSFHSTTQTPRTILIDFASNLKNSIPSQHQNLNTNNVLSWNPDLIQEYNYSNTSNPLYSTTQSKNSIQFHEKSLHPLCPGDVISGFESYSQGVECFEKNSNAYGDEIMNSVRYFIEACDNTIELLVLADAQNAFVGLTTKVLDTICDEIGHLGMTCLSIAENESTATAQNNSAALKSVNESWLCFGAYSSNAQLFPVAIPSREMYPKCIKNRSMYLNSNSESELIASASVMATAIEGMTLPSRYTAPNSCPQSIFSFTQNSLRSMSDWFISSMSLTCPLSLSLQNGITSSIFGFHALQNTRVPCYNWNLSSRELRNMSRNANIISGNALVLRSRGKNSDFSEKLYEYAEKLYVNSQMISVYECEKNLNVRKSNINIELMNGSRDEMNLELIHDELDYLLHLYTDPNAAQKYVRKQMQSLKFESSRVDTIRDERIEPDTINEMYETLNTIADSYQSKT